MGETALYAAAASGNGGSIRFLISKGADPAHQANDGCTSAMSAVGRDHTGTEKWIPLLIGQDKHHFAELLAQDVNGWSVLHWLTDTKNTQAGASSKGALHTILDEATRQGKLGSAAVKWQPGGGAPIGSVCPAACTSGPHPGPPAHAAKQTTST